MKNKILLASAGSATMATVLGISSVLIQNGGDSFMTALKLYQIAGMFGLLSIATFFVGWVFPKETSTGGTTVTSVDKGA